MAPQSLSSSLNLVLLIPVDHVLGLVLELPSSFLGLISNLVDCGLDVTLILLDVWLDPIVVDGRSSHDRRVEEIDKEAQLQEVVEWNELQDNSRELVDDVEGSETHPVGKPLLIILKPIRLQGKETHESRIAHTNDVSDVTLADSQHDHDHTRNKRVLHNFGWLLSSHLTDFLHSIIHGNLVWLNNK